MSSSKKQKREQQPEDPNALWGHAGSLEDTRLWEDKKSELIFMRDLFDTKLPIGENKAELDEYFNILEQAIDTKAEIKNDKFPDDYREIDQHGEVTDPPKQYTYFSADLFKQQASKEQNRLGPSSEGHLESKSVPQDVEDTTNVDEEQSVSDVSAVDGDLSCMEECSDADDPDHWAGDISSSEW